jgi:hypothetical protein
VSSGFVNATLKFVTGFRPLSNLVSFCIAAETLVGALLLSLRGFSIDPFQHGLISFGLGGEVANLGVRKIYGARERRSQVV